jgi:MFS family permease
VPEPDSVTATSSPAPARFTAGTIILAGCLISLIGFGPRSVMGFFQLPVISENGWGRDVFGLALAIQNLFWGLGQPFSGAIADRFGTLRVFIAGLVLYAAGLALMAMSTTPGALYFTAGILIGFGLSGCSFNLVLAAFGKLLPADRRPMALAFGTAAGSFGQFLFSPLSVGLIDAYGWKATLFIFAAIMVATIPLAIALATPPRGPEPPAAEGGEDRRTIGRTLAEAFGHPSYVLLVLGFFTCGFHLAFITVHMPAYFKDMGLAPWVGGVTLAAIGIFNIAGSLGSGWLMQRMPKRHLLAIIYAGRSLAILMLLLLPPSPALAIAFGAAMGLLWLSTVPPTSSLVMTMFGTRDMAMLYGFAFFSHQVGGFLGVWLGGIIYETTGTYDLVWYGSIALGVASAAINLPIVEKPYERRVAAPAA